MLSIKTISLNINQGGEYKSNERNPSNGFTAHVKDMALGTEPKTNCQVNALPTL